MMAAQIGVAMAIMTIPVLAPQIASDLSIDPNLIGYYSSITFLGAIVFTALAGSVVARLGSVRTTQLALIGSATGLLASVSGLLTLLAGGAFAVGMGYGTATPAASHILARTIPRRHRGFAFSVKQTGVPLGGFLAGIGVPSIAEYLGWQAGVLLVITILLIFGLALQMVRRRYDTDRDPQARISAAETVMAARLAATDPRLRPLSIAAFAYTMMQLSIFTFFVVVLVEKGGIDPVTAGMVFAAMHVGGVVGRPLLGWISDRILPARPLLSAVGFAIFFTGLVLAQLDETWPRAVLWTISFATGMIAAGWNGVYIAEIARIVPSEEVGRATGGVSAYAFSGVVIGPALFGTTVSLSGAYAMGFMVVGAVALVPALLLLRPPTRGE